MSDYLLLLTIILISIFFISDIWVRHGMTKINFIVQNLISFYILPSFLIYSMLLISNDNKIKKEWWWFGSFAIAFSVFIFIDFTFLTDYNYQGLNKQYKTPSLIYHLFYKGSNVFVIIILFWFLKKLKKYRQKIKDNYSFIEPIQLTWLENFTWIYIMTNALSLLIVLVYNLGFIKNVDIVYLIIYATLVISLFYLSFNGIRQYSLIEFDSRIKQKSRGTNNINIKDQEVELPFEKYKSSSLSREEMTSLFDKIKFQFEQEFIYLEPQLKIDEIAKEFGVTTHKVSQTINSITEKSFYDFVNNYRVEHFKRLLSKPENRKFTILSLGIESGFNSKASLNRIFKQNTGISPKEFQKKQYN